MDPYAVGLLKDILWYLKGAIELRSICELKDYHLSALSEIIDERQKDKVEIQTQ